MRRIGAVVAVVGLGLVSGCSGDAPTEGAAVASDERFEGAPCTGVLEAYDEHQPVFARTFGGGAEGRAAMEEMVTLVEARSDCFHSDTIEMARLMRASLPASAAEREALEAAETRCVDGVGASSATGPDEDTSTVTTPEAALDRDDVSLPGGEPRRVAEGEDFVAFEFEERGVFEGAAIIAQAEDGWFVRQVIDCDADEAVVEETDDR